MEKNQINVLIVGLNKWIFAIGDRMICGAPKHGAVSFQVFVSLRLKRHYHSLVFDNYKLD